MLLILTHKRYSNWSTNFTQTDPKTLLNLTHKRYSNWPTSVTQVDPQTLLNLTHKPYPNWFTNVIQIDPQALLKLIHKRYSNWPTSVTQNYLKLVKIGLEVLFKIVLQTLLRINFKGITKLKNLLAQLKL